MTLTELRYFITLSTELNFIKAADKLHISQPTLSLAIKKLEESCGGALVERNKSELKITELGNIVLNQARLIWQDYVQLEELIKQNKDPLSQPLRIGAIHTSGPYLFPLIISEVKQNLGIQLYIYEDFTDNLTRKLANGELDAIIVAEDFELRQSIKYDLFEEEFFLLINSNHDLAKQMKVSYMDIQNENLLILGEGHCFREQVLAACPTKLIQSSDNIIASSLETIRYMVSLNMGISVFPYLATRKIFSDTQTIKLINPNMKRKMILVCRSSTNKINIIRKLALLITKIYDNLQK